MLAKMIFRYGLGDQSQLFPVVAGDPAPRVSILRSRQSAAEGGAAQTEATVHITVNISPLRCRPSIDQGGGVRHPPLACRSAGQRKDVSTCKIIHSGFDTIYFSIQGALSPAARKRYEHLKEQAIRQKSDESFHVGGSRNRYRIQGNGKTGGYTYLIKTGHVGSVIAFKKNLSRVEHNGFAEISSACLLAHGWENAIAQTLDHVKTLGFHVVEISLYRADYCMDFLDATIDINPGDFIAHSRVKKTAYYESGRVREHVQKRSVAQSDHVKSLTLGKMPGRQIIVYDKRAEVIEKRKPYWFDAWGVDRADNTRTVHRVEVRAARDHLRKYNIRTFDDFERHIGLVLTDAVRAIRWCSAPRRTPMSHVGRCIPSGWPFRPTWITLSPPIPHP